MNWTENSSPPGARCPKPLSATTTCGAMSKPATNWIASRTGIRQRYFCGEGETATTLAIDAAQKALAASGLNPVRNRLRARGDLLRRIRQDAEHGLSRSRRARSAGRTSPRWMSAQPARAFCSQWQTARGLLLANQKRYALVIGAEQMSSVLDMADRNTCVLFGDGAGAAIFELCADAPYEHIVGVRGDTLIRVGGPLRAQHMTMDGQAVFRFAVTIPSA